MEAAMSESESDAAGSMSHFMRPASSPSSPSSPKPDVLKDSPDSSGDEVSIDMRGNGASDESQATTMHHSGDDECPMAGLVSKLTSMLDKNQVNRVLEFFSSRADALYCASACTGSGLDSEVLPLLLRQLAKLAGKPVVSARNKFFVEKMLWKRKWLIDRFPDVDHVFKLTSDLSADMAFDYVSNQQVVVPTSVDLLTGGFSCKGASILNPKRSSNQHCVADKTGSTGTTCNDIIDYIVAKRPKMSVLENVASFEYKFNSKEQPSHPDEQEPPEQRLDNMAALKKRLHDANVLAVVFHCNSLRAGFPHVRSRLWIIAVPVEVFGWRSTAFRSITNYAELALKLYADLQLDDSDVIPLEKFLVTDVDLLSEFDAQLARDMETGMRLRESRGKGKMNVKVSASVKKVKNHQGPARWQHGRNTLCISRSCVQPSGCHTPLCSPSR